MGHEHVFYVQIPVLEHLLVLDVISVEILRELTRADIIISPYIDDPFEYFLVLPVYPFCFLLLGNVVETFRC